MRPRFGKVAQQCGYVLANVVVLGALAKGLSAIIVVVQCNRARLSKRGSVKRYQSERRVIHKRFMRPITLKN